MENWKTIPGWDYEASSEGRIRNRVTGRILKPHKNIKTGGRVTKKPGAPYWRLELWKDGTFKKFHVHRLVLEAFVGPRPPGKQCRHLNGDSLDNRLENLAWGTNQEDCEDRRRGPRADYYLSAEDVAYIRARPTESCYKLAKELGCGKQTVQNVRLGNCQVYEIL